MRTRRKLLFSPFRDESSLLLDKKTSEQAFHRLLSNKSYDHHAKLKVMLEAAANVKKLIKPERLMIKRRKLVKRMMILN